MKYKNKPNTTWIDLPRCPCLLCRCRSSATLPEIKCPQSLIISLQSMKFSRYIFSSQVLIKNIMILTLRFVTTILSPLQLTHYGVPLDQSSWPRVTLSDSSNLVCVIHNEGRSSSEESMYSGSSKESHINKVNNTWWSIIASNPLFFHSF